MDFQMFRLQLDVQICECLKIRIIENYITLGEAVLAVMMSTSASPSELSGKSAFQLTHTILGLSPATPTFFV
jgi:hypothetical protein